MKDDKPILVAGATGYVGGRLIPALLDAGYRVRAIGRSLEKLACRPWGRHPKVELAKGDVLDRESLEMALSGCGVAYYLVHSMIAQKHKFVEADRRAAQNMVSAAESAGIDRIIYLGGLAEKKNGSLSKHLRSRIEVADILQSGRVPVLTPTLSAYWIHFISPVPHSIALPLTEGLSSDAVCSDKRIQTIIPQKLLSPREAIRTALDKIIQEQVDTCWADAGDILTPEWAHCGDADWAGGTIMRCGYRVRIKATPDDVWQPISRIGGQTGYYYADVLWWLRGLMDRLFGGVGLRRGRRHPTELRVGDALDFWRVLDVAPKERLLLLAEMKIPGEALLEFKIESIGDQYTDLEMLSRFLPKGLWGLFYWYTLYPFHERFFFGMLKGMAKAIEKPVVSGPERFTPRLHDSCALP